MRNPVDFGDGGALPAGSRRTRRQAIAVLARVGTLAVPEVRRAAAQSADPVFAAVERHKVAWNPLGSLCSAVDEVAAAQRGHQVGQADLDAYERAAGDAEFALDALLATHPRTAEGMRTAIMYILGFDDGYLSEFARPFLISLLKCPVLAE